MAAWIIQFTHTQLLITWLEFKRILFWTIERFMLPSAHIGIGKSCQYKYRNKMLIQYIHMINESNVDGNILWILLLLLLESPFIHQGLNYAYIYICYSICITCPVLNGWNSRPSSSQTRNALYRHPVLISEFSWLKCYFSQYNSYPANRRKLSSK